MVKRKSIVLFILLFPILYLLSIFSLSPVLNYGFTPDDWGLLLFYKTLGDDPLSKLGFVWSTKGAYTTSQVYFIGILNIFFGLDYEAYHKVNIILKTLATLSLYPLILVVFKRKFLAFLTTILYGTSYMGSRSLEYVLKGTDYLAIIPMSIFFIIYYLIIIKKLTLLRWLLLMSVFWFLSMMISPIRIYPILVLIPLIELYLWVQHRSKNTLIQSIKRLSVLYLPFLLLLLYKPNSILNFLQNPSILYRAIVNGNWHLILTPFQGMGLTVFVTNYWSRIFGVVNLQIFSDYLLFLLGGPLVIFVIFAAFLSFFKFKKSLKAFMTILFLTFTFSIVSFFIANHLYGETEIAFDPNRIYAVLIAGFMFAVSFVSFFEWKSLWEKDNLLLSLWISPPIIFLYTFSIWILAPLYTGFEGQQGYYLVVPAIASSLFLAAILCIIIDLALNQKRRFFKIILLFTFFICLIFLYLTNSFNTYYYYTSAGKDGRLAFDQDRMYSQILHYLGANSNNSEPVLFYFDVFENTEKSSYYYEESLFHNLPIRLLMKDGKLNDGCIGTFYRGVNDLGKLAVVDRGVKGFIYQGQCIVDSSGGNTERIFYKIDNFYAFKIKGRELIDIREEILDQLFLATVK